MTKKQLYESIMKNIAKEVKKAINESDSTDVLVNISDDDLYEVTREIVSNHAIQLNICPGEFREKFVEERQDRNAIIEDILKHFKIDVVLSKLTEKDINRLDDKIYTVAITVDTESKLLQPNDGLIEREEFDKDFPF